MNNFFILFFIVIINFPLFSQEKDKTKKKSEMNTYLNYNIQINFKNTYYIHQNHINNEQNYFLLAKEVVVFNDDKRDSHPHAQRLMVPKQMLLEPLEEQQILTEDFDDNTKPSLEQKGENYSSLNNSFGESSSLYILPVLDKKECITAINSYINEQSTYQLTKKITDTVYGNKTLLTWRAQLGKTRLDHYLVLGKHYNYLFVSSPYSDASGVIEEIIIAMEFID